VDKPANQEALFTEIVNGGLSVREAETLSEKKNSGDVQSKGDVEARSDTHRPQKQRLPELQEIEQRLLEALGTKVQLKGSLSSGRIEVSYYSSDDLERLIELLSDR